MAQREWSKYFLNGKMMEPWLIYSLLSVIIGGLYHFSTKIIAERGYDTNIVNFISYLIGSVFMGGILLIQGDYYISSMMLWFISLLAFGNVFFYTISILTRVEAMKDIDTVIFYPVYKTFGPVLVTGISFFYFREALSLKEVVGIILGICVPLLLITRGENKIQKNLFRGLILVFATAVASAISSIMPKIVQEQFLNIEMFLFLTFLFGVCISPFWRYLDKKKRKKVYNTKGLIPFSIISGFLHLGAFYVFTKALTGNLAIVFTINSFAILIPIILSIIFYGEHFSFKKGCVIVLSIISILLFI